MSRSADVRSVEAIERLRRALVRFASRSTGAVETLESQLRRAGDWIANDRPAYWREQSREAHNDAHQAKLDLERCLMFPVADEKPACREEKAVLRAAKDREAYCLEKIDAVKRFARQIDHEQHEFTGRVGHLKQALETELPRAERMLREVLRRIDAYQVEQAPPVDAVPEAPTQAEPPAGGKE
ncbi:MAG: hypothetical protein AAGA92_02865 [Planctomycetota bacterium]